MTLDMIITHYTIYYHSQIHYTIYYHSQILIHQHCYYLFWNHWYTDTPTLLWSYCYTDILYTISGTRIHQFTRYHHFIYWYHRYMDARYTVMSCLHITVAHACMVSLFLSYGSLFILHVYSCLPVAWLFPVIDIPVTGYMSCWYAMCGTKCHVDLSHGGHL